MNSEHEKKLLADAEAIARKAFGDPAIDFGIARDFTVKTYFHLLPFKKAY